VLKREDMRIYVRLSLEYTRVCADRRDSLGSKLGKIVWEGHFDTLGCVGGK